MPYKYTEGKNLKGLLFLLDIFFESSVYNTHHIGLLIVPALLEIFCTLCTLSLSHLLKNGVKMST